MMLKTEQFRARLLASQPMMGSFLKTPSAIVCEVLGLTALDCMCIDAEHAPFGRMELDACIGALRGSDMPVLVRVQSADPGQILSALDSGAAGVVLPHVISGAQAAAMARAARYTPGVPGGRGYAGSSRAARYTTRSMGENLAYSDQHTVVVAQIEDAEALGELDAIAAVEGIDCLFVGRMDLTVSLGAASPLDARVVDATAQICAAGLRHGKAVGMFVPAGETCAQWQAQGASLFLMGSDQQFLLDGARALVGRLKTG